MTPSLVPGAVVRHPDRPEWGLGRVQSVSGERATVDFDHRGKVTLDLRRVRLVLVEPPRPPHPLP